MRRVASGNSYADGKWMGVLKARHQAGGSQTWLDRRIDRGAFTNWRSQEPTYLISLSVGLGH